jgi:hypothetical protein
MRHLGPERFGRWIGAGRGREGAWQTARAARGAAHRVLSSSSHRRASSTTTPRPYIEGATSPLPAAARRQRSRATSASARGAHRRPGSLRTPSHRSAYVSSRARPVSADHAPGTPSTKLDARAPPPIGERPRGQTRRCHRHRRHVHRCGSGQTWRAGTTSRTADAPRQARGQRTCVRRGPRPRGRRPRGRSTRLQSARRGRPRSAGSSAGLARRGHPLRAIDHLLRVLRAPGSVARDDAPGLVTQRRVPVRAPRVWRLDALDHPDSTGAHRPPPREARRAVPDCP